jgi:putative glutamine amidotransferase
MVQAHTTAVPTDQPGIATPSPRLPAGSSTPLPPPVVGITADLGSTGLPPGGDGAALVRLPYLQQVSQAGGIPLLFAPDPHATAHPDRVLDLVDALLLTGGADIDPAHYGAAPHPRTRPGAPERDAFELALARRAMQRGLPLLGICRGMQLLNVARGGTLHQHLPDVVGHSRHQHRPATAIADEDGVVLAAGSLAARAVGADEIRTGSSRHHQGLDRIGDGLRVTGWAKLDRLPVAVELRGARPGRWVLGVQWHPEDDEGSQVIGALVQAARDLAGRRP